MQADAQTEGINMLKASKEAVVAFQDAFHKCQKSVGSGRTSLNMDDVEDLVRSAPKAAHDFVILHCAYAQMQPAALQSAMIVAVVLQRDAGDIDIVEQVKRVAEQLGQTDTLKRIELLKL
jgi:predicted protein tyrosine phosphatase